MLPKRYPAVVLGTCPVPWNDRGEFDEALFRRVVALVCRDLSPHVYVFGTAGEGYAVTERQFDAVIAAFRAALPAGARPMVGLISLSLGTVIERIERARAAGFQEFQLSLPSWGVLTDAEVDVFFRETCGRFPDCRFLHYNLLRAKRLLAGADYARLTAAHPNLVAIKMGGENREAFADILTRAPALQGFFTEFGYAAMRDGHECGLLAALSAANPARGLALFAARGAALAELAEEFRVVHRAIKGAIDPAATHMDGVYDKIYVKHLVPEFPLRLLPPYAYADDGAVARFRAGLPAGWRA
jgi:dihydrodipicolinate synthase/N-acetylneuraminate lyase